MLGDGSTCEVMVFLWGDGVSWEMMVFLGDGVFKGFMDEKCPCTSIRTPGRKMEI